MANDVDINVIARDQASKVLQDVTDRVSALSDSLLGLEGVATSTSIAADALNRLADTGRRIEILATSVGALVAAVGTAKVISRLLSAPISAFTKWTDATKGLTAAQMEYVDILERSVGVRDRVAADLLGLADAYGVATDKQDDLVTGAVGLAHSLDQNANSMLLKLTELLNGNEKALDSVIPQLRNMATASEKLAEVERLAASGLEEKHDAMTGLEGAQSRYSASLEKMARIIGETVAPAVTLLLNLTSSLADAVGNVLHSAMGLLHRDFQFFTDDLFDAAKMTEFFELALLSVEKTFLQIDQGIATLLDLAGFDLSPFLDELEARIEDIDRRAVDAVGRRMDAQRTGKQNDEPTERSPLSLLFNPSIPEIPEFDLGSLLKLDANADKEGKSKKDAGDTTLMAFESRLLNRGSSVSSAEMTAKNTQAAAKTLIDIQRILNNLKLAEQVMLKVNTA